MWGPSSPEGELAGDLGNVIEATSTGGRKHDGFRVIARKNGRRVKLYSRPGNDLPPRFPLIVAEHNRG